MAVMPEPEMALKAYSTWKSYKMVGNQSIQLFQRKEVEWETGLTLPSGEKTVKYLKR